MKQKVFYSQLMMMNSQFLSSEKEDLLQNKQVGEHFLKMRDCKKRPQNEQMQCLIDKACYQELSEYSDCVSKY